MKGILNEGPAMEPFRLMYMTTNGVSWTEYSIDSNFSVAYIGHISLYQARKIRRIARLTSRQENLAERLAIGKFVNAMFAEAEVVRPRR
jgi:hypothetical protein